MAISALGIGSGLDLNGLLDQLNAAEREKLQPLTQQRQSFQSKISAYGRLESSLSSFQSAVAKVNDPELFQSTQSKVDGDSLTAAAASGATVGEYSVDVTQLARAYSITTAAVADKSAALGAGSVDLQLANGNSIALTVTADNSSLENIRDQINAEEGDVRASIINDGKGYRLALASTETGTEAAISAVAFGGDLGGGVTLDAATEVSALNAQLSINNVAIESQSNQVEEAIEGITLSLQDEGASTVTVSSDSDAVTKAVKGMVSAYNDLQGRISRLTEFDQETGRVGKLLGDTTMRNVESYLRRTMTSTDEAGGALLSDMGISLQLNGEIELDEEKLSELVSTDLGGLSDFFAGNSETAGFGGRMNEALGQLLDEEGVLETATEGLESSIERVNDRYARMERTIGATISRYRTQFGQLDSMISGMNSTSSYLAQQFDMMNAQLGRK